MSSTRLYVESVLSASGLPNRGPLRDQYTQMLTTYWWPDFYTCGLPTSAALGGAHQGVVEAVQLHNPTKYNRMCTLCPIEQSEDLLGWTYKGDPARGKPDLDATRAKWIEARGALTQALQAAEVRRDTRAGQVSRDVRRAERDAWIQYLVLVLEYVRPAVIDGFDLSKRDASQDDYEAFLRQFELDARARRSQGQKGSDITLTWCTVHKKIGHMLPMLGANGYLTDCWQCPRALTDERAPPAPEYDADAASVHSLVEGRAPPAPAAPSSARLSSASFSLTAQAQSH